MAQQKYITVYFLGEIFVASCTEAAEMDGLMSFNSANNTWTATSSDTTESVAPTNRTDVGFVYWSTTVNGNINDLITLSINHSPNLPSSYSPQGNLTPNNGGGEDGVPTGGEDFIGVVLNTLADLTPPGGTINMTGTLTYFSPNNGGTWTPVFTEDGELFANITVPNGPPTVKVLWRVGASKSFLTSGLVDTPQEMFESNTLGTKVYWRLRLNMMNVPTATSWAIGKYALPVNVTCAP